MKVFEFRVCIEIEAEKAGDPLIRMRQILERIMAEKQIAHWMILPQPKNETCGVSENRLYRECYS